MIFRNLKTGRFLSVADQTTIELMRKSPFYEETIIIPVKKAEEAPKKPKKAKAPKTESKEE